MGGLREAPLRLRGCLPANARTLSRRYRASSARECVISRRCDVSGCRVLAAVTSTLARGVLRPASCGDRLRLAFHNKAPYVATVYNWFNEFERGRTNLTDDLREGRSSTATTEDNISAVWFLIETDKIVSYQ
ncbi:hypothetical protein EVAR_49682_1 [Eumeta japonica]|uniref:Mos1 transposase HTH domain-containing protein n=1 Tax=Eumeta variegata TaxID=151549 RepID=A0A4C1WTR1_EUMVA|nr:hypothetical protein EVAR_49682_1 [Eumeta japonica]